MKTHKSVFLFSKDIFELLSSNK